MCLPKTAEELTLQVMPDAQREGIFLSAKDAEILRKASLTFHRWDEKCCGWSTPGQYGASIALVRDEDGDGKPYLEIHPNTRLKTESLGRTYWVRIPDREAGALRRGAEVCERNGLDYYRQNDPRGCSLYISTKKATVTIAGRTYDRGAIFNDESSTKVAIRTR